MTTQGYVDTAVERRGVENRFNRIRRYATILKTLFQSYYYHRCGLPDFFERPLVFEPDLGKFESIEGLFDFLTEKAGCDMIEVGSAKCTVERMGIPEQFQFQTCNVHTRVSEASSTLSIVVLIIATEEKHGTKFDPGGLIC